MNEIFYEPNVERANCSSLAGVIDCENTVRAATRLELLEESLLKATHSISHLTKGGSFCNAVSIDVIHSLLTIPRPLVLADIKSEKFP